MLNLSRTELQCLHDMCHDSMTRGVRYDALKQEVHNKVRAALDAAPEVSAAEPTP